MSENTANKRYSEQHKKWIADENSYGPDLVKCTEEEKYKYYEAGVRASREYYEKKDYKTDAIIVERLLYLLNSRPEKMKKILDSSSLDEIAKSRARNWTTILMSSATLLGLAKYYEKTGNLVFDGYPGRVMKEIPSAYSLEKKYSSGIKILLFILSVLLMVAAVGLLLLPEIATALVGEEGFNALGVSIMAVMIFSCRKFKGIIIPAIITGAYAVPVYLALMYIPLEWLQRFSASFVSIIASILLFIFWRKYSAHVAEEKKKREQAKLAITYGRAIVANVLNAYPEITDLNKVIYSETIENDEINDGEEKILTEEEKIQQKQKRRLEYIRLYCKAISNKVNDAEEELKK